MPNDLTTPAAQPLAKRGRTRLPEPPRPDLGAVERIAHLLDVPVTEFSELARIEDLNAALAQLDAATQPAPVKYSIAALTLMIEAWPQREPSNTGPYLAGLVEECGRFPPDVLYDAIRDCRRRLTFLPAIAEVYSACCSLSTARTMRLESARKMAALHPERIARARASLVRLEMWFAANLGDEAPQPGDFDRAFLWLNGPWPDYAHASRSRMSDRTRNWIAEINLLFGPRGLRSWFAIVLCRRAAIARLATEGRALLDADLAEVASLIADGREADARSFIAAAREAGRLADDEQSSGRGHRALVEVTSIAACAEAGDEIARRLERSAA